MFAELADEFMSSHGPKLKASTQGAYARILKLHLMPRFAGKALGEITKGDISRAHGAMAGTPRNANYALSVMSKLIAWAVEQGYRREVNNPCRGIQRYKEVRRERYLSSTEARCLGEVLDKALRDRTENPYIIAAIWMIVFTGARKREVMDLKWSFVDKERRAARLPDSKTGPKTIALNSQALEILGTLKRMDDNPYVFPGRLHGKPLNNFQKVCDRIREEAGIEDMRLHDLRHTFGSSAVDAGGTTRVLGRQLGHANPTTTGRYEHVSDHALHTLVEATGDLLASRMRCAMSREPAGHYIRFRRRKAA
jgi:integrase